MNTKAKLLVIDDEVGPRESLRFLFKDQYDVVCVDSVDNAVQTLRAFSPDCIITDIKMPGKTGLDGLREIRSIDQDVSIIMLTGFGSLETAQQAIRYGASDYVKKPFDAKEMRDLIASHMDKSRFNRRQRHAYENLQSLNEQLQEELQNKEHLAELGQASSEFVHDLRNPLTVICGYVSLLMSQIQQAQDPATANTPQHKNTLDYLEQLERSVQRCQEMSQTWREISKENAIPDTESVEMLAVMQEVVEMLQPIAKERHVQLNIQPGDNRLTVTGSNLQIFRAIQNLVSNALQAVSKDGSGTVTLHLQEKDGLAHVIVRDNGPGIPADQISAVFAPYVSTRKSKGGMGLGLFITRKIIEGHHGTIDLQNHPDGGLCATIKLPCNAAESSSRHG